MTKANSIEVEVTTEQALEVAKEILLRIEKKGIPHPKMAPLPEAVKRLQKAARRWQKKGASATELQTISEFPRNEAYALHFYISLFFRPDLPIELQLPEETRLQFQAVGVAIRKNYTAKRGPDQMSEKAAQKIIETAQRMKNQPLADDSDEPDPAYVARVQKRIDKNTKLLATPLNPLPPGVLHLMCKNSP